jgi:hypothetical protein
MPISETFVDEVAALLAKASPPSKREKRKEPEYDEFHEAAAVLSTFDPVALARACGEPSESRATDALLNHSTLAERGKGGARWVLAPQVRIAVLRQLRERRAAEQALDRAGEKPGDPLQEALESYLRGRARPVAEQSLEQLAATFQATGWLRLAGFEGIPEEPIVRQRVEWLNLLQPFEHLAGAHFRGRTTELETLREYADVLAPNTLLHAVRKAFRHVFDLHEKPPLLIYGPGGVGKSTLLARFILEHAKARETRCFPFIYLDFDRPDIQAQETLTLLLEAVRQIGIEYPEVSVNCERIRGRWVEQLARREVQVPLESVSATQTRGSTQHLQAAIRDFASLVGTIGAAEHPVVLVLDTFEEVQYRSEDQVAAIWDLLEQLQPAVPRLRVIIAGRSTIAGRKTEDISLHDLDVEAAIGYLGAHGVTDEKVARRMVEQVGGTPLNLQLAAEVYARDEQASGGELGVKTREYLFLKMGPAQIQRQLYKRVLGHVHRPEIRQLAHPGLVLRRVTADLIREVLAEPCGLGPISPERAQELFEELGHEVALVTVDSDGALRHRPDLRRLMVELLLEDEPEKTWAIHAQAVKYYAARPAEPRERAEEIYHRLQLGHPTGEISGRWLNGVEPYLESALAELTGARRAFLAARLNVEVDPETRRLADLEDWETLTARKVEERLAEGRADAALELLRLRPERTSESPLPALESRALIQLRRFGEAIALLAAQLDRAKAEGRRARACSLALASADAVLIGREGAHAPAVLAELRALAEISLPPGELLLVLAHTVALAKLVGSEEAARAMEELRRVFDELPDEHFRAAPNAGLWVQYALEAPDAARLARLLRLCGLPTGRERAARALACALADFDAEFSRRAGHKPGWLAEQCGLVPTEAIVETWTRALLTPPRSFAERLSHSLAEARDGVLSAVIAAFANLAGAALGLDAADAVAAGDAPALSEAPPLSVSGKDLLDLAKVILKLYQGDTFREFCAYRLDRSLESLVRLDQPFRMVVIEVLQSAHAEGWLGELILRLYQDAPYDDDLQTLAQKLGLRTAAAQTPAMERILHSQRGIDPRKFRERLAELEAQVCRLEEGGKELLGTGFLVGPDLVLTTGNWIKHRGFFGDVWLRFDVQTDELGHARSAGMAFRDAQLLYRSGSRDLEWFLMRVKDAPGAQPIGGERAGANARLRGWMRVPKVQRTLSPGEPLYLLHHDFSGRLSLTAAKIHAQEDAKLSYALETPDILDGAPCLNSQLELVGLHLGARGYRGGSLLGVGLPIAAIVKHIQPYVRQSK